MDNRTNNIISLFEQKANLLNMQNSKEDVDDAIGILANWIHLNAHELTEDDLVILTLVGGVMYRSLNQRRN